MFYLAMITRCGVYSLTWFFFKPWMKPGRFLSWFSEELCDLEESRLEAPMATFVTRGPTNTYLPQVSMWPHHDVTPRPGIKRYVGCKL